MQEVNLNFNYDILNFNGTRFSAPILPGSGINALTDLFDSMSKLFEMLGRSQFSSGGCVPAAGCSSPPVLNDSCHPSGSLKTDGNRITTPGGYTIEPMGRFEWKITGPDGKSTRVWGDPHVAESDGGKWDFKRNSTFVLPDGTRVNVTTKPWRNGMTVTSGLEVISGNERVLVSDIDKGKGRIGSVTQDGWQFVNGFGGNDVFVMGRETDDWSFRGKEIIGSNNGGDSFRLGSQLAAGSTINSSSIMDFLKQLFGNWDPNWRPNDYGTNPYYDPIFGNVFGQTRPYECGIHQQQVGEMFRAVSYMFDALSRFTNMNDTFVANRNRGLMV